jgi:hypothetical protein
MKVAAESLQRLALRAVSLLAFGWTFAEPNPCPILHAWTLPEPTSTLAPPPPAAAEP